MDTSATREQPGSVNYLRPIWARRWLIAFIVVIATVGTYVYYNGKPRLYGAATTLYVSSSGDIQSALNGTVDQDPDRTLLDLARLITSPPVVEKAVKLLGSPRELGSASASAASGSDFIEISAEAGSPIDAAATANAYAQAFIDFRTNTIRQEAALALAQVQAQLAAVNDPVDGAALEQQVAQLKEEEANPVGSVQEIQAAAPDFAPLSPNPKKDAIFALALSLMVGIALAYGLDRLDQRIRTEDDIPPIYGAPIVGEIPHVLSPAPFKGGVAVVDRDQWESFRALRTNLELATGSKALRTILVASALAGEGKSLVVRNLAIAYADAGLRVGIIEADLRRPSLAQTLDLEPEPGLTDVLARAEMLPRALQALDVGASQMTRSDESSPTALALRTAVRVGTVDVVTSGTATQHLTASLAAEGIKSVLARMTEEYDVVLIDSPPLLAVSDAVPLLGVVDGVVMVARLGLTTEHAGRRVADLLGRATGTRVLGVVANDLSKRAFQYSGNYGA